MAVTKGHGNPKWTWEETILALELYHQYQGKISKAGGLTFNSGPGLPEVNFSGMPNIPLTMSSSANSPGLELVDIYLWLFRRAWEGGELAPELEPLIKYQQRKGNFDEMSLEALEKRWTPFFQRLQPVCESQMPLVAELTRADEERRLRGMANAN